MSEVAYIAPQKMELIQSTFRRMQALTAEADSWQDIVEELDASDIEFRSIAYEAAAMEIALKDLSIGNELSQWQQFVNGAGKPHATQVHVGLGWALAQLQLNPLVYLEKLSPILRYRVLDGYGYYDGIFRKRKAIINRQLPELDDAIALSAYCQGLGRSIWYSTFGDIDKAKEQIDAFDDVHKPNLWRGIGIACAYVGGCTEAWLYEILSKSAPYSKQLKAGAVMLAVSRQAAGFTSADTELVCEVWLGKTAREVVMGNSIDSFKVVETPDVYSLWVGQIEHGLS